MFLLFAKENSFDRSRNNLDWFVGNPAWCWHNSLMTEPPLAQLPMKEFTDAEEQAV